MLHVLDEYLFMLRPNLLKDNSILKKYLDEKKYEDERKEPPLVRVTLSILDLILDFARHRENDQGPIGYNRIPILEWDANFIDANLDAIISLIEHTTNLRYPALLNLVCQALSDDYALRVPEETHEEWDIEVGNAVDNALNNEVD